MHGPWDKRTSAFIDQHSFDQGNQHIPGGTGLSYGWIIRSQGFRRWHDDTDRLYRGRMIYHGSFFTCCANGHGHYFGLEDSSFLFFSFCPCIHLFMNIQNHLKGWGFLRNKRKIYKSPPDSTTCTKQMSSTTTPNISWKPIKYSCRVREDIILDRWWL